MVALVAAWEFLVQDLRPGSRGPGLVTHWQQRPGLLVATGATPVLRIWDMAREQLWSSWSVASDTYVTAVTSPPDRTGTGELYFGSALSGGGPGGGVIAAGMANGAVKLYDARDGTRAVRTLMEHESWIVKLHFAKVRCEILSWCPLKTCSAFFCVRGILFFLA